MRETPPMRDLPDDIATGVGACQAAGKRVLLSIGGATGSAGFASDADGQQSAQAVWDIFLGGQSSIRPFAGATLDGIDHLTRPPCCRRP
jgi:chitinase